MRGERNPATRARPMSTCVAGTATLTNSISAAFDAMVA